ncbi:MAG: hypothetical protein Q9186_006382 [Xanthomendoza sp. 1 TL-2023]
MGERTRDIFLKIPNEILIAIFQYSTRSDLLKIRFCSRTCNQIAAVYLFKTIVIRTDETADEIAQCPIKLLEDHAKELRLSVIGSIFDLRFFHHNNHHAQLAWTRYDGIKKTHYADLEAGRCPSYLAPILSMNKLRKVVFINGSFNPHLSSRGECGLLNCTHQTRSSFEVSDSPAPTTLSFRLLMIALFHKKVPITQLIARSNRGWRFMLDYDVFVVDQHFLHQIEGVFSNLTSLHLDLETGWDPVRRRGTNYTRVTNLPQLMRQATGLEHLSIDLVNKTFRDMSSFRHSRSEEILQGCIFPKLRTCLLSGFRYTISDIRGFLHGCRDLEELCLEECKLLPEDYWEVAASAMKDTLRALKDVQIVHCFGRLGLDEPDDMLQDVYGSDDDPDASDGSDDDPSGTAPRRLKPYGNRCGLVQDFFFRSGPNPFGAEGRAMERAKFAEKAKDVVIPGWLDRMQRIHGYVEEDRDEFR